MGYRNVTEILETDPHKGAWIVQCGEVFQPTVLKILTKMIMGEMNLRLASHTIKEKHHELKS